MSTFGAATGISFVGAFRAGILVLIVQKLGGLFLRWLRPCPTPSQEIVNGLIEFISSSAFRDIVLDLHAQSQYNYQRSISGNLISDFGSANVRSIQAKKPAHGTHTQPQSNRSSPYKGGATTTTSSVADLTAAIAALELSANPTLSKTRRKCLCNASIHPFFETAPNCLNCGKIICALEGLQPCSSCDSPILTRDQANSMIKTLKVGIEKMVVHNVGRSLSGRGTPIFGGSAPDRSGDKGSSVAAHARAHRDKPDVEYVGVNTDGSKGAFRDDPLLASGRPVRPPWLLESGRVIWPVWKAPDGGRAADKGKGREPERKSVWRMVQDDNEDNMEWILDGGLHIYGKESRLMEEGSQTERG